MSRAAAEIEPVSRMLSSSLALPGPIRAPDSKTMLTLSRDWAGILRWFHTKIANGILEAISSLVQAAKAKTPGCRSTRNLKAIISLASSNSP
jgi:hypothetical protein